MRIDFNGVNNGVTMATPGNFTVTFSWSFSTPSTGTSVGPACTTIVSVQTRPYFRVMGGDILNTSATSQLSAFNKANLGINYTGPGARNDSSGRSGSGAQGLVINAGTVSGIASGLFTGSALLPKPLTLANTGPVASAGNSLFGGGYIGSSVVTVQAQDPSATVWAPTSTSNGSYRHSGNATYGNGVVGAGTRMTVYITGGDLTINGNIIYSNAGTGYASRASIPHIKFIVASAGGVGGNIYVLPSVRQIDAELVAEKTIDTCRNNTADPNAYNVCNTGTLVVNGSLTASKVSLNRLNGTLRESWPESGSLFGACPAPVANGYCDYANTAEIIQFTPELYLSNPAEAPPASTGNRYDSITALPPLF